LNCLERRSPDSFQMAPFAPSPIPLDIAPSQPQASLVNDSLFACEMARMAVFDSTLFMPAALAALHAPLAR
jgi:hypothetical protein